MRPWFRILILTIAASALLPDRGPAAEPVARTWRFGSVWESTDQPPNPAPDEDGNPVWHFLRTTRSTGPVQTRTWAHDGRYARLTDRSSTLFGSPIGGWIFRKVGPPLAPLVARVNGAHDLGGATAQPGMIGIAPGPDHAIVIGWQSPVEREIEVKGEFRHAQGCCGVNSQINWYVERGPAPDLKNGFKPESLAKGHSDFGTKTEHGAFKLKGLFVEPGDFLYFIADAHADGTTTVHHGDFAEFTVAITARNARPLPPPTFEKDIRPILARACFDCHGEGTQEAQLDLRTVTSILQGGENGHGLVRGDASRSLLYDMIVRNQMPPDAADDASAALTLRERALISKWIRSGAPADEKIVELPAKTSITDEDRAFWAFQRPVQKPLPEVKAIDRARTAVDSFILARLEEKQLTLSSDAARVTLLRRAYFNLLGLPPTPEEVDEFLDDKRPDAWERLIDQLLASPHYGERWGRHWLDAAGYVDNRLFDGDLATIYPNDGIWRYRDYVVRAMNADKPYDRFVTEQRAGDELFDWRNAETDTDETRDLLAATGYFRSIEDHTSEAQYGIAKRYEVVFDTMKMVSSSLLGLTMECCRCHNHKYDPIPQRDYYRLMATIEPALNPRQWLRPQERWQPSVSPKRRQQIDQHNAAIDARVKPLNDDLKKATEAKDDAKVAELKKQIAAENAKKQSYGKMQVLWDVTDSPPPTRVFRRGIVGADGVLIEAGFPEILSAHTVKIAARPDATQGVSSGRRLALANWITDKNNPLTARVIVNRIWHHHFGRGIVATPGNLGRSGAKPTHPELLDWLAVDLMEHNWSLKRLHKLIMTSSVFRQSSEELRSAECGVRNDDQTIPNSAFRTPHSIDPDNTLLWRMPLRRLESEIIRDSVLAVSGQLNPEPGGPPVMITKPADGLSREEQPTPKSHLRRSLYLFARRVYPLKFLEVFDSPIVPVNCTQRMQSATVLQSFTQLNDSFMKTHADTVARLVLATAGDDAAAQVDAAWRRVLSRSCSTEERERCVSFVTEQRKLYAESGRPANEANRAAVADLCHMLLCANEFLYVE